MVDRSCRSCRKFGQKLFLKGERCLSAKCAFTRRNYAPGLQGARGRTLRKSEFGLELQEKQKAKAEYLLRERQFAKIFRRAARAKDNTGEELLRLLEMRLDNVVYRLGWASSRKQARQMVSHQKIKLNDKIVNIPSIVLKPRVVITLVDKDLIAEIKPVIPKWLKLTSQTKAEILKEPAKEEIESDLDEEKILEYYSR